MKPLLLLALALAAPAAERTLVFPAGAKPIGPYSPGILTSDFLYVSGQGARTADGRMPATFPEQVRLCLDNIKTIVEAAHLTMDHVVYIQVYLKDLANLGAADAILAESFPANPPARATIGVHRMPTDTPVEISAVAVRDLARRKSVAAGGVLAAGRLFVSGCFGSGDTPEAQVESALGRFHEVLTDAGMDWSNVVFVNPYLTSAMPQNVMNRVYARHFEHGNTPARATIEVAALPRGAAIEFTGVAIADLAQRRAVRPKNMPPSPTASPCVWAADTFYCSAKAGFIPGPNGGIWAGSVEDQVRQTMRNLLDGLEEAGLDFSRVVATNVYLDDIEDFARMNGVYAKYFPGAPPTRTTVSPKAPVERRRDAEGRSPKLEEISVVAVR